MNDTSVDIEARMSRMMNLKSPTERLRMAFSMFDAGKKLVEAGLRSRNKNLNDEQMRAQVFMKIYGEDFSKPEIKKILSKIPKMQLDEDI